MPKKPALQYKTIDLPVLPLRDVVVFPHMVIPLFVGRVRSVAALEAAVNGSQRVLLVAQKDAAQDSPSPDDIYRVGAVAAILQMLKMPDGTVKVLVEGKRRATITRFIHDPDDADGAFACEAELVEDAPVTSREADGLVRAVAGEFERYVKLNPKIPPEILTSLAGIDDPGRIADTVAAHLGLKNDAKQKILELTDAAARLEHILGVMDSEIDLLQVEKRIRSRVKKQMEKSQREYYLNEQMKAIQKELGEMDDVPNETDELAKKIAESGMSADAREKAEAELKKLKMMSPMSAEATVVRNYIDWLLAVPWKKMSRISKDLAKAQTILDEDHYGLEKVKDRILEYLAVQQRVKKSKAAILCLVGPPGVGKTSLGKSSRARPTASFCACRWAACATKPKSAATAAPTSARCRAKSSRTWRRAKRATRCLCWTKSTRCRWTFAATRRRRCWRCSTRNKTTPSATTTWKSTTTYPMSCSSPPPTR